MQRHQQPYMNTPRPYNQGRAKNNPQSYPICNQIPDPVPQYFTSHYTKRSADVAPYPVGGGGAARLPIRVNQYPTSVAAIPPNSAQQVQQVSQSQQLRTQAPPAHNPHNAGGGPPPPPSVPQPQRPHAHSAIAQHAQHHTVISTGGVSGAPGGLAAPIQQVPSGVVPLGTSPSQQVSQHDLNAQGIPQGSTPQIQQVPGVALSAGTNSVMFTSTNQNAQQQGHQQPNQGQYYQHHGQQNAAHMHGTQQQARPVITAHAQQVPVSNFTFPYMQQLSPLLHSSSPMFHQQFSSMQQHRPGAQPAQSYQPLLQQHPYVQYHQMHNPLYYNTQQQPQVTGTTAHVTMQTEKNKNVIAIIDPETNRDILEDFRRSGTGMKPGQSPSPVQSRDSSAGNTPAPLIDQRGTPPNQSSPAQQFALQVTQVATVADEKINKDTDDNAISTMNISEVVSHSDIRNDDNRESVRPLITSNVDTTTSKDADVIKDTRIVPEHNVSTLQSQQPQHSSLVPTQMITMSLQQVLPQPPPQPQRPSKQQRGVPSAAVSITPPNSQVAPQHQIKPGSNQPQSKQSPPPQVKKQPQPKNSGTQISTKGSPPSSQHGIQQHQAKGPPPPQSLVAQKGSPQIPPQQPNKQSIPSTMQQQHQHQQSVDMQHHQVPQITPPILPQVAVPHQLPQTPQVSQAVLQPPPPYTHPILFTAPPPQIVPGPSEHRMVPAQGMPTPQVPLHLMPISATHTVTAPIQQQMVTQSAPPEMVVPQQIPKGPISQTSIVQSNITQDIQARLHGEQPPQQAGAPIKPVEKQSLLPEEQSLPPEHRSMPQTRQSKSASPVPAATKEASVELTQPSGKRGKEKSTEDIPQQPRNIVEKETSAEVSSQGTVVDQGVAQVTTVSQPTAAVGGKPPKTSPKENESEGAPLEPQSSKTSQNPKCDSSTVSSATADSILKDDQHSPPSQKVLEPASVKEPQLEQEKHISNSTDDAAVTENDRYDMHSKNKQYYPTVMKMPTPAEELANMEAILNDSEDIQDSDRQSGDEFANFKNAEGKLQYNRNFLLELQKNPLSLKRPDSLPNLEVVLDGPHSRSHEFKSQKVLQDFTPAFMQGISRSRGGTIPYMQQKMVGGRNSQQGRRPQKVIDIKLSSSSEVKLKTSENAWKPGAKKNDTAVIEDAEVKHEELLKRMRGILNKLTPDNFDKLVVKVRAFPIETYYDLDGIIGLIFEKAVDEQAFSSTYAVLCQVLSQMTVKDQSGAPKEKEGKNDGKEARFRNLIITRCQKEFEKDNTKDQKTIDRKKLLETTTDDEERHELLAQIDYEETKLRKRSVGNIRFIGELYKLKMLTSPIMMRIISGLLEKHDEESLECLCKLLTTIGKNLESSAKTSPQAQDELNARFDKMKGIINDKKAASSRVRFLMMDVVDLRKNSWVPRREDAKPKTKAQVHEDIRQEEAMQQQQLMMASPIVVPRQRDDRERKRSRDNRGNMNIDESGWSTVGGHTATRRVPLDAARLKSTTFIRPGTDNNVEFRAGYSSWAKGSSGGVKDQEEESRPNRFAILDSQPGDIRRSGQVGPRFGTVGGNLHHRQTGFGSKSMPPPSEKENVMPSGKLFSQPGDRSKSNSRSSSRDNSVVRENSSPAPPATNDYETIEKYTKGILEEYTSNKDAKEAKLCIEEKFHPSNMPQFIQAAMEWTVDRDTDKRTLVGKLFHDLLAESRVSMAQFQEGTKSVIEMTEDYMLDIPQLCPYLGEILACLLIDGVVQLEVMLKIVEPATEKFDKIIFAKIIHSASRILGVSRVQEMWIKSGLQWHSLLNGDTDVKEFVTQHGIDFTVTMKPMTGEPSGEKLPELNGASIRGELLKLFKRNPSDDEIFGWIEANVGSNVNSPAFVRALTTALVESLMITSSDGSLLVVGENFEERLRKKVIIINKYVDNSEHLELHCVLGIQALSVENEHPQGFMEHCFNVFYDTDVLSDDAFLEWSDYDNAEEQNGKGVCLASVRKFLNWLKQSQVDDANQTSINQVKQSEEVK